MNAYDMSQYMRLIQVEGGRVTGLFKVSPPQPDSRFQQTWVQVFDITVWDAEQHQSGRVLYSADLTCSVSDGVAELSFCSSSKEADIRAAWEHIKVAVEAAAAVFPIPAESKPESTVADRTDVAP